MREQAGGGARQIERLRAKRRERPALAAFLGVSVATLLGFVAVGATLPVLPRYVRGPIGAGDLAVGLVTGAFAVAAIVARPLAGRLADARGRRAIVAGGSALMATAGVLYLLPAGVPGLVVARLVLGAGEGFVFTAGATWVIDLAPPARRGQAIGMFGLAVWGGLSVGSVIGEGLRAAGGYDLVWAFAALSPVLGALLAVRLPDRHEAHPQGGRGPLVPRAAVRPGAALALANVGYATLAAFVVLHLDRLGEGHGAAVFTAFATAVVVTRLAAGRLPDLLGPTRCAIAAGLTEAAGLAAVAAAGSWWTALAGGIVMGAGFSLLFPSLALLVMDRTDQARRGAALGAFTAFFDAGVAVGALAAGAIAASAGYPAAFWAAAACAAAGAGATAVSAGAQRASGMPASARPGRARPEREPVPPTP